MTIDLDARAGQPLTAPVMLQEAGEMIAATFWVQAEEIDYSSVEAFGNGTGRFGDDLHNFLTDYKHLRLTCGVEPEDSDILVVTGVCSIGAMALACVSHQPMSEREGILEFSKLAQRDKVCRQAAEALRAVIVRESEAYRGAGYDQDAANVIASWNDGLDETTGRAEVVRYFDLARAHPFAAAEQLYLLMTRNEDPIQGRVYLTAEEAAAERDGLNAAYDKWQLEGGDRSMVTGQLDDFLDDFSSSAFPLALAPLFHLTTVNPEVSTEMADL